MIGFALQHIEIDESGDLQIRFGDGDERFDVGEKTDFARYGRSYDFARVPPDTRGLAGHEGGFDLGIAVGGGAMSDDAVVELHIGALSRDAQCNANVSCRWNRKRERRASGLDGKWNAGIEADGEFGIARKDGRVGAIFEKQRKRFRAVARIENGHPRGERDFSSVRFEGFAIELDRADHIVVDDVEF